MAQFPLPIGIDRMLLDIAEGIGAAARKLPEASRSAVGAVAMKRANVQIDFELSGSATRDDDTVGLGARTFLFGIGSTATTTEDLVRNHGRIELEIVAIAEPPPPAIAPDDDKDVAAQPDRTAIRSAIGLLRAEVAGLRLERAEREGLTGMLDEAFQFLTDDKLDRAAAVLADVKQRLERIADAPRRADTGNDT